ncbi:MAG: cysteine hydrolase [Ruminococcaceae bacterium]|nr:cysteine hydrolase [Oscillospiraceae bacterium]
MKRFLIVVDMQKDFVDGALGSPEAVAIVPCVVDTIRHFDGEVIVTYDTHTEQYMNTNEGSHLPVPHCIKGTEGWQLDAQVATALATRRYAAVEKPTFGSVALPRIIRDMAEEAPFTIELIGLCTDICVVSNALLLKAHFPESEIYVDAACCAGVSPETHRAALETMRCCQIQIKNDQ